MTIKHNNKNKLTYLYFVIAFVFSFTASSVSADEGEVIKNEEQGIVEEKTSKFSDISGYISAAYDTNIYSDYRKDRSLSWSLGINTIYDDKFKLYASTGAYRSFDSNRGDFNTNTVVGVRYQSLFEFASSGNVALGGQFTIPTYEYSRKDNLITAFRLDMPVSFEYLGLNWGVSPRIKKNFHTYETRGGRSLTEWTYSLSLWTSYSWSDFSTGLSMLGGETVSYQGTVRDQFNYSGSVYLSYSWTDKISTTISAANAGYYADTEKGTIGNIDFFDSASSSYNLDLTYQF